MVDSHPLDLTHNESCYLSDCLSSMTVSPIPQEEFETLWLKIGCALLETVDSERPTSRVSLSEGELWTALITIRSAAMVGQERVGYALLLRVFRGLRKLRAQEDIHAAITHLGETDVEEPVVVDMKTRIDEAIAVVEAQRKRKVGYAGTHRRARKSKASRGTGHKAG